MIPNPTPEDLAASIELYAADLEGPERDVLRQWFRTWFLRAVAAEQARDKLQAFKIWVHQYLDAQGVPYHPPGTHGEHGCRIGDRMDWWVEKLKAAERERDELRLTQSSPG